MKTLILAIKNVVIADSYYDGTPLCDPTLPYVHWIPTIHAQHRQLELEARNHRALAAWRERYWNAGVMQ